MRLRLVLLFSPAVYLVAATSFAGLLTGLVELRR